LPVQSGSTPVLRRMKRDYTRDEYLRRVELIKAAKREITLSTDIIVGFPGESQADFEDTLSLMEEVRYDSVFSFKYSPRPGTEAYSFEDAVPEGEQGRRLAVLQEFQRKIQLERNTRFIGKEFEVLVEGKSRDVKDLMGRTTQNKIINFPGPPELLGKWAQVRVTRSSAHSLQGELVSR
jgi:tRNA-2-methylthio-N6-dimethylallyladenosine synthase